VPVFRLRRGEIESRKKQPLQEEEKEEERREEKKRKQFRGRERIEKREREVELVFSVRRRFSWFSVSGVEEKKEKLRRRRRERKGGNGRVRGPAANESEGGR
jgi:hypothetical protein